MIFQRGEYWAISESSVKYKTKEDAEAAFHKLTHTIKIDKKEVLVDYAQYSQFSPFEQMIKSEICNICNLEPCECSRCTSKMGLGEYLE